MNNEFMMKAILTKDGEFIFEIDGFKIHDSNLGNVINALKQIAKNIFDPEERKNERKKVLEQYAIEE